MKTLIKIVAWIVGGLVLLGVGLAAFVAFVVDPNEYKPQISSLVEKQIGRKLTMEGDLELTLFPWLGVRAGNVTLSNPPGFDDPQMLTVVQVEVRARLMPLLSKQFEADTIVLRDPSVHLIVDADGTTNWQDLAQLSGDKAPEPQPTDPGAAMAALAVQGIDLKGGRLIWEDRQAGSKYVVDDIDLDVGEVLSQEPVDLSLALSLKSDDLEHAVEVDIESQITLSLSDFLITLSQAQVKSRYGAGAGLDAVLGKMTYDFDASRARLEDLVMESRYANPGTDQSVSVKIKTDMTANIEGGSLEVGKTALDIDYGEAGKATGGFDSLHYNINQGLVKTDTFSLSGSYKDQALENQVSAEIHARVAADLAGQTVELGDGLVSATHGSDTKANARFEALHYDLASSEARVRKLDLSGSYSDANLPQPVSFNMKAEAVVNLVEQMARLAEPKIHVEYGALGNADIGSDAIDYQFETTTVDIQQAAITGTYSGPELDQPVAIQFNGGLKLNTGTMVAELARATAKVGYGTLGDADIEIQNLVYRMADSTLDIARAGLVGKHTSEELEQPLVVEFSGGISANVADMTTEVIDATGSASFGPEAHAGIEAGMLRYDQGKNLLDARALKLDGTYDIHDFRAAFSELTADIAGQKADAPDFDIQVDGVPARGNVSVSNFLGDAAFTGVVRTGDFKPDAVLKKLGIDFKTEDPKALSSAALSMKFNGSLNNIRLDDLEARLDETNLSGFVEIVDFSQPAYRFDLAVDGIDVDRYAPQGGDGQDNAGAAMVVLPVGLFKGLRADGELKIGSLRASGVNATDIQIGVSSTEQELLVKPISAALYGGTLDGDMRFTEKDSVARLKIQQTMDQVEVGGLLADTEVTDRITGKGQLELDVVAIEVGGQPQTKGTARFHFFDGAIKGFNLRKIYLQAKKIYNERKGREEEVASEQQEVFKFTEMKGTLEFNERTASNDDLEIKSPLFRITGHGQADLAANQLNYLVLATVVESAKGQGGEELGELKGVTLPIRISGGLDSPVYTLDVATILKLTLQRRVEQEVEEKLEEKLQEKLGDELKDQLGDELQKLFKID